MKQVCILFTKYSDFRSRIIYMTTGRQYTHSSIAIEDGTNAEYYSFNYKGFAVETLEKHKRRGVEDSLCIKLKVSDEKYESMKAIIDEFKNHRDEYHYYPIGVLFLIMGIPLHFGDKRYVCSHFVAELLEKSETVKLKKRAYNYSPNALIPMLLELPEYLCSVENIV